MPLQTAEKKGTDCKSAPAGGKFANGAVTGAYTMMFNDLMHQVKAGNTVKTTQTGPKYFTESVLK